MPLTLYRRHTPECAKTLVGLSSKAKRLYKECDCWIWYEGRTSDGVLHPRQTTKQRDWAMATAKIQALDADAKDVKIVGEKLEECITLFLAAIEHEVKPNYHENFALILKRLKEYAANQGKLFIREFDVDFLEDFKIYGLNKRGTKEPMMQTSKTTSVKKLRRFLKEAFRRKWITESLAQQVKSHKSVHVVIKPFEDFEVPLILQASETMKKYDTAYAQDGPRFRLLLELMLETGMRISDAVRFDPAKCIKSKSNPFSKNTFLPMKTGRLKEKKLLTVFISDSLKTAIDQCVWMSPKLPFASLPITGGETDEEINQDDKNTKIMSGLVYNRMQVIAVHIVSDTPSPKQP
jgi:site-specific recombinase XerD